MTWPEELAFIFPPVPSLLRVLAVRRNKTETPCVPSTISSSISPLYSRPPFSYLTAMSRASFIFLAPSFVSPPVRVHVTHVHGNESGIDSSALPRVYPGSFVSFLDN